MRSSVPCAVALALVACSSVPPRPAAADATGLPQRPVDAASAARRDELTRTATAALLERRYAEAERDAMAALQIDPRAPRALAVRGMAVLQRARRSDPPDLPLAEAGETDAVLAVQLAPDDAFVGWLHAALLAETGHLSAAAAAADAALERCAAAPPAERAALLGIAGTYHYELGEERAALPLLQAYTGLRPGDASAHYRIGACLLRIAAVPTGPRGPLVAQQQAEAAAVAFDRSAQLAPQDLEAALAIGTAWLRAAELAAERKDDATRDRHHAAAVQLFQRLAGEWPQVAEPSFRLGLGAEAAGDRQAARAAYTAALERDAEHLGALLNLAALALADGDQASAAGLLQRALDLPPERSDLREAERKRIAERLRTLRVQ
jgi:Flp pilus assembly protein TadD